MDRFELARRLHVAVTDVRDVVWVDGECYVTMADGAVRLVTATGVKIADKVPVSPVVAVPVEMTVVGLTRWIGDDLDRARCAWYAEQQRDTPRKGLLRHTERLMGGPP